MTTQTKASPLATAIEKAIIREWNSYLPSPAADVIDRAIDDHFSSVDHRTWKDQYLPGPNDRMLTALKFIHVMLESGLNDDSLRTIRDATEEAIKSADPAWEGIAPVAMAEVLK